MIYIDIRSYFYGIFPEKDRIHSEQAWVYTVLEEPKDACMCIE